MTVRDTDGRFYTAFNSNIFAESQPSVRCIECHSKFISFTISHVFATSTSLLSTRDAMSERGFGCRPSVRPSRWYIVICIQC